MKTILEQVKAEKSRNARLMKWVRAGTGSDLEKWEDTVWWGYWCNVGGEDVREPDALFPTERDATAFATLLGKNYDIHVGPCVLTIETRDNIEVPE